MKKITTKSELKQIISAEEDLIAVVFSTASCARCMYLKKALQQSIDNKVFNINIYEYDCTNDLDNIKELKLTSVPSIFMFKYNHNDLNVDELNNHSLSKYSGDLTISNVVEWLNTFNPTN